MPWSAVKNFLDGVVLPHTDLNTYLSANTDFLKDNIALGSPVELTLDGAGVVTKTKSYHTIDTNADDPSDELVTINGGNTGDIIFIQAEHDDRTIIIKDGTGNIHSGADIYLEDTHEIVMLMYDAMIGEWHAAGAIKKLRCFPVNTFQCPNPGTDWTPQIDGCHLGANKTDKKFWIALSFFKIGDMIISYEVVGDATQTNALTLDAKLVRINKADPITTTDVAGGDIAQVSGGGNFDVEATLTAPETIATDKQYAIELSGLTGVGDTITVMGIELCCIRVL